MNMLPVYSVMQWYLEKGFRNSQGGHSDFVLQRSA
jgi:hypothetical protein